MRCGEARRVLWPDVGPREVTTAVRDAESHLRSCEACRRFLAEQDGFAAMVREQAPKPEAPARVRAGVFESVARERARASARPVWIGRVAALVLVVAGAAWWGLRVPSVQDAWGDQLAALAADHVRAAGDESLMSSDVETVRDWLTERVSFGVHVPDMPDARLAGARLCFVNGQRSAVVEYRVDNRDVSFYLMPAGASAPTALSPAEFVRGADSGYEFIAWQGAGLVHALVGSVPEARLRQMARSCLDLPADGTRP